MPRNSPTAGPWRLLLRRFEEVLGAGALEEICREMSDRPAILIAGDQLTGKPTAARNLGARFGFSVGGTGESVRTGASREGIEVEEMTARLEGYPDEAVRLARHVPRRARVLLSVLGTAPACPTPTR